jgi:GntR family transcriptional regulator
MSVHPDSPIAPYRQIAGYLQDEIDSGRLKPGDRLPSARMLAEQFNVSGMTINSAIRVLRDAGELITTQRGTFVADLEPTAPAEMDASAVYETLMRQLETMESRIQDLTSRLGTLESEFRASRSASQ